MRTKTRLRIVLALCASALTLNVLAVVEEFYALPEVKTAETTLQGYCLVVILPGSMLTHPEAALLSATRQYSQVA